MRFPQTQGIKILRIRSNFVKEQIFQVIKELELKIDQDCMFSRCTICNQEVRPIDKRHIKDRVPEYVYRTQKDFSICPKCKRIYWQGSHWGNVSEILEKIKGPG